MPDFSWDGGLWVHGADPMGAWGGILAGMDAVQSFVTVGPYRFGGLVVLCLLAGLTLAAVSWFRSGFKA